jgi:hypothetical protein
MKLNLTTTNPAEQAIKAYLEANASAPLAEKINFGTPIEKDGKQLINRKTLQGFFKYAESEARKLAEKGANFACVADNVVFGWAIHYFEESAIEGELFNQDGTPYKAEKKAPPEDKKKAEAKNVTDYKPKAVPKANTTPGTKPGTTEPKKAKILPTPKAPEILTKRQKKKDTTQISIFDLF